MTAFLQTHQPQGGEQGVLCITLQGLQIATLCIQIGQQAQAFEEEQFKRPHQGPQGGLESTGQNFHDVGIQIKEVLVGVFTRHEL